MKRLVAYTVRYKLNLEPLVQLRDLIKCDPTFRFFDFPMFPPFLGRLGRTSHQKLVFLLPQLLLSLQTKGRTGEGGGKEGLSEPPC